MSQHQDLSTAFAPKKKRPASPPPAQAGQAAVEQEPPAQNPAPSPGGSAPEMGPQNVPVYMPQEVLDRLKRERVRQASTYSDLLVDAFDQVTEDQIRQALGLESSNQKTQGGMPRRARRRRTGGGVQVQFRLDADQQSWIDQRVLELDAPSRSALVSGVLDLALPR